MSATSLKVLLYGFGNMNKIMLRYVVEKGHNVVGVVGHHHIGDNPFTVAGLGSSDLEHRNPTKNLLITSKDNLVSLIHSLKPDVAIVATRSTLPDVSATLEILGHNGVNAITIAEEVFYSWNTSRDLTHRLDQVFKDHNVSFTGTGAQDVFWGFLPYSLLGSTHSVKKIRAVIQFNVDDYGRALCEAHGVGLSVEQFDETIANSPVPSYNWNSNEWLAVSLGWNIVKTTQKIIPILVDKDIHSKAFNDTLPTGRVTGSKAFVVTACENGVVIETEMVGTVYHGDMFDCCSWNIEGEPNTELVVNRPATVEITCASTVNRLRQIVNARAGYVPTFELGLIPWKA